MIRPNRTKAKLLADHPAFGILHSLAHPAIVEMIGLAGYDFVVIDGEHGMGDFAAHLACIQSAAATPVTSILRVASHELSPIRRALDLGVEGLLIPDVRNAAQARSVAGACFYPPKGTRGFSAGTIRASDYGMRIPEYVESDASELLLCLMIESAEGAGNAEAIAATAGVNAVQVGPFDLSCDLGIPGQFEHPDFLAALKQIEAGVLAAGKVLGGVPLPGLSLDDILQRGHRMITMGADMPMMAAALKAGLPSQASE